MHVCVFYILSTRNVCKDVDVLIDILNSVLLIFRVESQDFNNRLLETTYMCAIRKILYMLRVKHLIFCHIVDCNYIYSGLMMNEIMATLEC